MTRTQTPSLPPALHASEGLLAMGRRIAETYANRILTDAEIERISQAYADLMRSPRSLVHHDPEQSRVFAVMDGMMWVVDHGRPWCFVLPAHPLRWRFSLQDPTPFVAMYDAHKADKRVLPLLESGWILTSFCSAAREIGARWMMEDVRLAFDRAGLRSQYISTGSHELPNLGQRIRVIRGRTQGLAYQLRIIGATLCPIREAIDREVRRTLWAAARQDGRLAQWLLDAPCERTRLWRSQALRLHRLLLPRLLTLRAARDEAKGLFSDDAQRLTVLIDAGQPCEGEMAHQLGSPWTPHHVRWVAKKGRTLSPSSSSDTLWRMVESGQLLCADRPFKRQRHWQRFDCMMHYLESWLARPSPTRMGAFLKGCPKDWDDPFYRDIMQELTLVQDARKWVRPHALWEGLTQTLTLQQALNLARRLHEVHQQFLTDLREERMREDNTRQDAAAALVRQRDELCRWTPAGATDAWSHRGHEVHELVCLADTWEEGDRMHHCVGNGGYAASASLGHCRLFSIRECASGRSISTFEARWDRRKNTIHIRQHFGSHDRPAPSVAKATLRAWLLARRCQPGPWPANATYQAIHEQLMDLYHFRPNLNEDSPVQQRFHQAVRDEIVRRFPALRAASLLPHQPPTSPYSDDDF